MTQTTTVNRTVAVAMIAALVLSLLAVATPASAAMNSSFMVIGSSNEGAVVNVTSASADTGNNTAGGSRGGRGGSGGDIENGNGDNNNGGAEGGNGGAGDDAATGGTVKTGEAVAEAGSLNALNTNETDIDVDGGMNSSGLVAGSANAGFIFDATAANAETGDNNARGSRGGRGGSGGEVEVDGNGDNNNGGAAGGNGGAGGDGAEGGWVETGATRSEAGSINVLNTNLVRVRI